LLTPKDVGEESEIRLIYILGARMTVHEQAFRSALDHLMAKPDGADLLSTVYTGFRAERWEADYVAAIGQIWDRSPSDWPMHQMLAFAYINAGIMSGQIAVTTIAVEKSPLRDRAREQNAARLSDLLARSRPT
jgi:hypothetical protein